MRASVRTGIVRCRNINECTAGTAVCGANQICRDTIGDYKCICKKGFHLADASDDDCSDVDECALSIDNCNVHSTCENSVGGFDCTCEDGFVLGNNNQCEDVNECEGTNDCNADGACLNTLGGYECACPNGSYNSPNSEMLTPQTNLGNWARQIRRDFLWSPLLFCSVFRPSTNHNYGEFPKRNIKKKYLFSAISSGIYRAKTYGQNPNSGRFFG